MKKLYRLEQTVCGLRTDELRMGSRAAGNIKLPETLWRL